MKCRKCGKEFTPTHHLHIYCHNPCYTVKDTKEEYKEQCRKLSKEYPNCWYCGIKLKYYDRDHIIPSAKGGVDDISNKALACFMCNMAKSSFDLDEFLGWLAHIRSDKFNCYIIKKFNKDLKI